MKKYIYMALNKLDDVMYQARRWRTKLAPHEVAQRRDNPDLEDQVEAIMKQFNYMKLEGMDLVQPLDDVIGKWLQVKEDYPKEEDK